jgi:Flp pilus assembly protein TadG
MTTESKLSLARFRRDRRGAVAVFLALGAMTFMGFGAVVVDVGYVYHAKRVLQASADAAALAGAMQLSTGTPAQAVTAATNYSGGSGDMNANANLAITANPQTVNCSGQSGGTCTVTATSPNGIKVTETTNAPTYFARILGINGVPISTTAYALQSGGKAQNYDIMIILDTTASMNSSDSSCSSNSRLNCAFNGLKALLQGFTPPTQQIGLMIFPGLKTAAEAAQEYDCSSSSPGSSSIAAYNASASAPTTTPPNYLIVPLSSDYKSGSSLNTSSNLVIAARGGASGCTAGVTAYGGVGTFYADAITAADTYLDANARTGSQKMIILLGDGDASASSTNMTSSKRNNQCHEAITASTSAQTTDGTTVVTIAYGSPGSGSCSTDSSPSITACNALKGMASTGTGTSSAPQWFYADSTSSCTSGHSATNLNAIFTAVGTDISSGGARLIPNS